MKKKNLTPKLLWIMQQILQKFPKTNEVRVESWSESDSKTFRMMMEIRIARTVYP